MNLDQLKEVSLSKLQPGQKHDLNLKFKDASDLLAEVKQQIAVLEKHKQAAVELANLQQAQTIEGLQDSLQKLQANLMQQIQELTTKLQMLPAPIKKLFQKLEKDCAQYISAVKQAQGWLYRGSSGSDEYVAKSWLTRRTKDSNNQAQQLFDQMLASLGFVALRGNSIFVTSDYEFAEGFGEQVYVIFPVDNRSHFTYTDERDIVLNSLEDVGVNQDRLSQEKQALQDALADLKKTAKFKKNPLWFQRLWDYSNPKSFWSWEAIRIELSKMPDAYANMIPARFKNFDPAQLVDTEGFVKKYHPQKTDLAVAILDEVEVCISGVYYALSVAKYHQYLSFYFGVEVREY